MERHGSEESERAEQGKRYVIVSHGGGKKAADAVRSTPGCYRMSQSMTTDASGRMYARGDVVTSLIPIKN